MAKKSGRHVNGDQAREHERRAWHMRCYLHYTQEQIATELGVSIAAVSRILRRVNDRVLDELSDEVQALKARQTTSLESLVAESVAAWERSKKAAQEATTRTLVVEDTTADGAMNTHRETTTTQHVAGQVGDVRFLEQARAALADVRAIWGANAPAKIVQDVTTRAGKPPIEELSEDELHRIAAGSGSSGGSSQGTSEAQGGPPEPPGLHDVHET